MAIADEIEKSRIRICIDIDKYNKCYAMSYLKPHLTKDDIIDIYERLFCDEKRVIYLEQTALFIKTLKRLELEDKLSSINISSTETLYDNVVTAAALSFYFNYDTKDFEDYIDKEKIVETIGEDALRKIEKIYGEIKNYSYDITKPVTLPATYFGKPMVVHTAAKLCIDLE